MFRVTSKPFKPKATYCREVPLTDDGVHIQAQSIEALGHPTIKGVLCSTACTQTHIVPVEIVAGTDTPFPDDDGVPSDAQYLVYFKVQPSDNLRFKP